ncbi:MAG: mononuclear molybdenum enzyme YedY [Cyanobacteria bacterium 13_1_40CM_2_61_4]|nr:MAG: mononuclear molybdenum enzyme YedY [Cyanobacteria bacterium 13_1_40CM_2_61_4]
MIRIKRSWEIPENEATPEAVYWRRRSFLRAAGLGLLCASGLRRSPSLSGEDKEESLKQAKKEESLSPYPAKKNPKYPLDRPLTDERIVTRFNNFYEFSFQKELVARYARNLVTSPWQVEVSGLVLKPKTFGFEDLLQKMPLEERLYRLRCVEAWAMAVPWTGFPLSKLLDVVEPLSTAKYVRFVSFHKPEWARNFGLSEYPWPYFEGLSLAEARNELTLLVTGLYGKPLPNQNGAPIRLIVPWKYGFKSIKSIVKIELVAEQPATFWNTVIPGEYDFVANVNPKVAHPRWSQATERMVDTGERRPTLPYNGYSDYVAGLY